MRWWIRWPIGEASARDGCLHTELLAAFHRRRVIFASTEQTSAREQQPARGVLEAVGHRASLADTVSSKPEVCHRE